MAVKTFWEEIGGVNENISAEQDFEFMLGEYDLGELDREIGSKRGC